MIYLMLPLCSATDAIAACPPKISNNTRHGLWNDKRIPKCAGCFYGVLGVANSITGEALSHAALEDVRKELREKGSELHNLFVEIKKDKYKYCEGRLEVLMGTVCTLLNYEMASVSKNEMVSGFVRARQVMDYFAEPEADSIKKASELFSKLSAPSGNRMASLFWGFGIRVTMYSNPTKVVTKN